MLDHVSLGQRVDVAELPARLVVLVDEQGPHPFGEVVIVGAVGSHGHLEAEAVGERERRGPAQLLQHDARGRRAATLEGIEPAIDPGARAAQVAQLGNNGTEIRVEGQRRRHLAELTVRQLRRPETLQAFLEQRQIPSRIAGEGQGLDAQGAFDFAGDSGPDLDTMGRRAVAVRDLVEPLHTQLDARGESDLFASIELPLVGILARMEANGVGVDRDFLESFGNDLRQRLGKLETSIHDAAGGPFNVNSTLQLREILFDRLELPVLKKTPKGVPSTDASVLGKLRTEHPIVDDLLTYRELEKLRSTYVDALLPLIEVDGRVRGRFNQMAAATRRLSQEQPNLQNIPVRSAEGRAIRKAFVSAPGSQFLVADYSQIELRILAHLSGDPGLVEAFKQDFDIHAATAANVNGVDIGDVTIEQRRRAKMINFGLLYGMEAYGLAQRLEIGREEAQEHIDVYFDRFPEVRDFMQGIVAAARESGYTTTLLGRRRYLPELSSGNFRTRQAGERMALNAPIQGSAADIIKKAMVVLEAALRDGGYASEMLLQIHDELVLEVPEGELEEVTSLTKSIMEDIVELRVPLRVESASGPTLADCEH